MQYYIILITIGMKLTTFLYFVSNGELNIQKIASVEKDPVFQPDPKKELYKN